MLALLLAAHAAEPPPTTPHECLPRTRGFSRPRMPAGSTWVGVDPYPIRIWYDPTHPHSVEILDDVAATLRTSWATQVGRLGFRPPVLPDAFDGPEFDVYLIEYQPFAAYVAADLPYRDASEPDDGYNASTSFMVVDRRLPEPWIPSYLAHEFNHACQYATDFSEPTLPIWEATATSAQEWTVGEAGRWEIDVPSLQEASRFPTLVGDSYAIWYEYGVGWTFEYGAAFWVRYLDEKVGRGDGRIGAVLWENAAQEGMPNEPDAVDAFAATGGADVGTLLNGFALTRVLVGRDWDPRGLSDAGGWGPRYAVPADPLDGASAEGSHAHSLGQPMITGQVFWELDLREVALPDDVTAVRFEAPSPEGDGTGLMVATWGDDGAVADEAVVAEPGETAAITVPAAGLARVVVGITNLGPAGWDGDDDPYVEGDQALVVTFDRPDPPGLDSAPIGRLEGGGGCAHAPGAPWLAAVGLAAAWVRAAGGGARRTGGRSRARGR